ncbi:MAG: acyl-CoA thioesterase [bacterium]|nr:acyl-CoA thioesterase [bacterium]
MTGRKVGESAVNDHIYEVFPNDLNAHNTVFGGAIMLEVDRLAGAVARRHSGEVCVTLSLDSLRFLEPAKSGEVLVFKVAVNRVWNTSMEIGVKVFAENIYNDFVRHVVSAYLTFVAIDSHNRPIKIRPVIPETKSENRRFQEADQRRQQRFKNNPRP